MTSAQVDEIKRHFGAVVNKILLPLETLSARIDRLDAKIERLHEKMVRGFEEFKVVIMAS